MMNRHHAQKLNINNRVMSLTDGRKGTVIQLTHSVSQLVPEVRVHWDNTNSATWVKEDQVGIISAMLMRNWRDQKLDQKLRAYQAESLN